MFTFARTRKALPGQTGFGLPCRSTGSYKISPIIFQLWQHNWNVMLLKDYPTVFDFRDYISYYPGRKDHRWNVFNMMTRGNLNRVFWVYSQLITHFLVINRYNRISNQILCYLYINNQIYLDLCVCAAVYQCVLLRYQLIQQHDTSLSLCFTLFHWFIDHDNSVL